MATVAETISLLQQYADAINSDIPTLQSLISQMSAINTTDPNAKAQLDGIENQYQLSRTQFNSSNQLIYDKFSAAFDSLSDNDKSLVNASAAKSAEDAASAAAAAVKESHTNTLASTQAAIQAAAAQTATPENATTTAPAPGASANTKPGLAGAASDDSGSAPAGPRQGRGGS